MSDAPSIDDAITEVVTWAWHLEGFEADSRKNGAVQAADEWHGRAQRLRKAEQVLRAIRPHEDEVRRLITGKNAMNGAGNGKRSG